MSNSYERLSCRFCGSLGLVTVFKLGTSPLCDEYKRDNAVRELYPLELNLCNQCGAVQTRYVVQSPDNVYHKVYLRPECSGNLAHCDEHIQSVLSVLCEPVGASLAVEVGSNDGFLLRRYRHHGFRVLGVEPFSDACDYAFERNSVDCVNDFFDVPIASFIRDTHGRAKVVVLKNIFANIDRIEEVAKALDILLDNDGVIVIESAYLFDMFDTLTFDFIYHEHLSYLHLRPMQVFFGLFGFKVFHIERLSSKGGSIRYFIARKKARFSPSKNLTRLLAIELAKEPLIHQFNVFSRRVLDAKGAFLKLLDEVRGAMKVMGYGASATTTTLLHAWQFGDYLDGLFDDNPYKFETYSPGYGLRVSEYSSQLMSDADTLVILAWRFLGEILPKLKDFSGNIIVPLPSPVIIQRLSRA